MGAGVIGSALGVQLRGALGAGLGNWLMTAVSPIWAAVQELEA